MSLAERLAAEIAANGPMSVSRYMDACLNDPAEGYYATRPALGADGDFLTAPHVTQMFGELLGLWAAEVWLRMGRPSPVRLVEIGPGDGTMMIDILRAARSVPAFLAAIDLWLVETSVPLRALQQAALASAHPGWATRLEDLPDAAPTILVANEVLDCCPIDQAVMTRDGWRERRVGRGGAGSLAFESGGPSPVGPSPGVRVGSIREWSDVLTTLGRTVGRLLCRTSGVALFLDYGRDAAGFGDTLQALRRHRKEGPLASPGSADLTAHVDFPAFLAAARAAGARTSAIREQGNFLRRLGIENRARMLIAAHPDRADRIGRQLGRLIDDGEMGKLFKAVCVHSPGLDPPAFEAAR